MPNELQIPDELASKMGNIPVGTTIPGQVFKTDDADALSRTADAEIAAREAAKKAANPLVKEGTQGQGTTIQDDPNAESDEQIQAKLDTLAVKEEKDLTDDEKAYITKYTTPEATVIQALQGTIAERYGITFDEAAKFDESPEGVAELIDNVLPQAANNMLLNYFEQYPAMKSFFEHVVQKGLTVETFLQKESKPAFESVELREITPEMTEAQVKQFTENQRSLVRTYYSSLGLSLEEVEAYVELAEAKGDLFSKAGAAKTALKTKHNATIEAQVQLDLQRKAQDEQQVQQVWKEVQTMFTKNDFNGRNIPPADLKMYQDAVFKVDGQGKSLMDYKRAKMSLGDRMFADYLLFKDFKASGYVKPPEQTSRFKFQKIAKGNDARNGGRLRGAADSTLTNGNPNMSNINMGDFLNKQLTNKTT